MVEPLTVTTAGEAHAAAEAHVPALVDERFASRLFAQDPTLWGADAESEAAVRLSWTGLAEASRSLVEPILALRTELAGAGIDRVVLCGMGGSSLAPEVICETAGVPLVVLDSSDPDQVREALVDLERTVVVVSSKSGSTVETDSQRRAFVAAFTEAGIDASGRIVIVTDPGSPLESASTEAGYRIFNADPHVGGRYSALTAFGLVPSGLAGADISGLLDDAAAVVGVLSEDSPDNPGLVLGAAMAGTDPLRDKLVLVDAGSGLAGFPDWAEQLIAESTGKQGQGILPVAVLPGAPELTSAGADLTIARIGGPAEGDSGVGVSGALGAQMMLWEVATSVAGRLLGINPFDQPDVESAKNAARALLDDPPEAGAADFTDGAVGVTALGGDWLGRATTLEAALAALWAQVDPDHGYVAVMAYLDRLAQADLAGVRPLLAKALDRPVTFGWGPRFLHSTGQLHKGGPSTGVYLQITGTASADLPIPDREFGFATLIAAQAAGDAEVLASHGRPVLRVHLDDQGVGLAQLRAALA